jgi:hypothetical protein
VLVRMFIRTTGRGTVITSRPLTYRAPFLSCCGSAWDPGGVNSLFCEQSSPDTLGGWIVRNPEELMYFLCCWVSISGPVSLAALLQGVHPRAHVPAQSSSSLWLEPHDSPSGFGFPPEITGECLSLTAEKIS